MPRTRRSGLAAPYFHVAHRSVRRVPIFVRPTDYRAFLKVLEEGLNRYPVRLVAFCVLADHWDLVLRPDDTPGLMRFMQWVTATHAIRWQQFHQSRGQGSVYQGRYRSTPLDGPSSLIHVCRQVERNALRERLVQRAQDWPWCSLAERMQPSPSVPLISAPFLMSNAWIDYVNTAALREQLEAISLIRSGRDDVAQDPGVLAALPQCGDDRIRRRTSAHDDEPDAHVEGAEHLRIRNPAGALKPLEDRRHGPTLAIE